jgi:hypothetical protein
MIKDINNTMRKEQGQTFEKRPNSTAEEWKIESLRLKIQNTINSKLQTSKSTFSELAD